MKKKILILNRWDDEFSDYRQVLPKNDFEIHMICKKGCERVIELNQCESYVIVENLSYEECYSKLEEKYSTKFQFDLLISLSEFDMIESAKLREKLNIPGPKLAEVICWRDKNIMKKVVAENSLKVPDWKLVSSKQNIIDFFLRHENGIVLKPLSEAASNGVFICKSFKDIDEIFSKIENNIDNYEMEEFLANKIGHIDGIMRNGEIIFGIVSEYIGDCLSFREGNSLGSVTIDNLEEKSKYLNFAQSCLNALKVENSVFHLEFFFAQNPIFLEVGVRMGGGEIPFVVKEVFGVNLFTEWLKLLTGQDLFLHAYQTNKQENKIAGFLMLPEVIGKKLIKINFESYLISELYFKYYAKLGQVFDGNGGYEKILARFRYKGQTSQQIKMAIQLTQKHFQAQFELV